MTQAEIEKLKMLFDIAKSEYQRELDKMRQINENAMRMSSFAGLLFTIFSVLVWRLMVEQQFTATVEWLLYGLCFVISALILLIISSLLRVILSTKPAYTDFMQDWQTLLQHDTNLQTTCEMACQQYFAVSQRSRIHAEKQSQILQRVAMGIQLSYLLLGGLVGLLFLVF